MSTEWIRHKRRNFPTKPLKEILGCSAVEAFNKTKIKEKPSTPCKPVERPKKVWVLFVNPAKQTFYVEEQDE
jgi:hypothetical protein